MQGQSGLRAGSEDHLLLDAGAVYFNFGLAGEIMLGATRGGNEFDSGREIKEIEVDGTIAPLKGFRRRSRVAPKLTVNLLELTVDALKAAIAGSSVAAYPASPATKTHDEITGGAIKDTDYITNVAYVGTLSGATEDVIIILDNCLCESGLQLSTAQGDEAVITLEFMAHALPSAPNTEPFRIRWPVVA